MNIARSVHGSIGLNNNKPLYQVHMDSFSSSIKSIEGYNHVITFVDAATGYLWTYGLKSKDDVIKALRKWYSDIADLHTKHKLVALMQDNASEHKLQSISHFYMSVIFDFVFFLILSPSFFSFWLNIFLFGFLICWSKNRKWIQVIGTRSSQTSMSQQLRVLLAPLLRAIRGSAASAITTTTRYSYWIFPQKARIFPQKARFSANSSEHAGKF
jgi:hypothetical protein